MGAAPPALQQDAGVWAECVLQRGKTDGYEVEQLLLCLSRVGFIWSRTETQHVRVYSKHAGPDPHVMHLALTQLQHVVSLLHTSTDRVRGRKNSAALPLSSLVQQQQQPSLAPTVFFFALYGHKNGGVTEREGGGAAYCCFWRRTEGAGLRAGLEPLEPTSSLQSPLSSGPKAGSRQRERVQTPNSKTLLPLYVLKYFHFVLVYTLTSLWFRGKCCSLSLSPCILEL